MRRFAFILGLAFAASLSSAQPAPEWRTAPERDVLLRPWAIEPGTIRLEAGRPVRLRFVNQGQATHSFSASEFFRSAQLRPRDADIAASGRLRLAPGERRTVALVPAAGRYSAGSSNLVQWMLGLRAAIVVD